MLNLVDLSFPPLRRRHPLLRWEREHRRDGDRAGLQQPGAEPRGALLQEHHGTRRHGQPQLRRHELVSQSEGEFEKSGKRELESGASLRLQLYTLRTNFRPPVGRNLRPILMNEGQVTVWQLISSFFYLGSSEGTFATLCCCAVNFSDGKFCLESM